MQYTETMNFYGFLSLHGDKRSVDIGLRTFHQTFVLKEKPVFDAWKKDAIITPQESIAFGQVLEEVLEFIRDLAELSSDYKIVLISLIEINRNLYEETKNDNHRITIMRHHTKPELMLLELDRSLGEKYLSASEAVPESEPILLVKSMRDIQKENFARFTKKMPS